MSCRDSWTLKGNKGKFGGEGEVVVVYIGTKYNDNGIESKRSSS